jgi:hypothetical protein
MFDINNFVIDRVKRGCMALPSTGDIAWFITQIADPSLNCTSETTDATDAMNNPIMQFERAKRAEFSANNSLFDLSLAAAQFGTEKNVASDTNVISTPCFEIFTVEDGYDTIELKYIPTGVAGAEIAFIYGLRNDETLGVKYGLGDGVDATDTTFLLDAADREITLPTNLQIGSRILVRYMYDSVSAVEVVNSATNFPTAGEFIMEVLGSDPCSPDLKYAAYIIFPNAKLTSNVDITFTTEGNHPFNITALQDYCDPEKRLFRIVIPEVA